LPDNNRISPSTRIELKGIRSMNWKQSAAAIRWNIQPFINGRYRPSASKETLDNINPASETVLCQIPAGHASDVDEAVRVARQSFEDGRWSELPPLKRAECLNTFANLIVKHKNEIALLDSLEMGKPITAALYDAETFSIRLLRSWAGFADKLVGETAPIVSNHLYMNVYEPRGVIAAITPWNFPSVNAVYKFGPALAAGNAVVLKPSELSPSSALKLAELALEAGVPEGVLNIVPGLGSTVGAALALHSGVDMVSFTGSTVTGRKIMELCGRSNGKPLLLELGGKSPQVVFNDVHDLDKVAEETVASFLRNSGQVCSAHTRLLVQEDIKAALLQKVLKLTSQRHPGNPLDEHTTLGPLASPAQRDRVAGYIDQGLKSGADAVLKGTVQRAGGCYVSPYIFDRVQPTMSIAREEIFGPVLSVLTFKTEEAAIALANGTDYGLAATVWTSDMGRGKRLAHATRAGHVSIRTGGPEGPASGIMLSHEAQKTSGFGAETGLGGLKSYSTLKSVNFSGA
jgi:acyl-CoA reductase-like NAD-dependent aldehyde dehydrogenase